MSTPTRPRSRVWTFWNTTLVTAFLVALVSPVADRRYELDTSRPTVENRTPAPLPAWPVDTATLRAYPAAFERHWNDTFGFRRTLVRGYGRLLVAFHTSPYPARVTIGSDGWLFYAQELGTADYRGEVPFRESELVRWKHLLENRRDWLRDRGIPYVFFVAPSKETIYADKMPWRIRRGAVHRLDQLLDFMAAHSDLAIIDPRPRLAAARAEFETYFRTDSHWSARGAWLVKEQVIERIAERLPAVTRDVSGGFSTVPGTATGDLVAMLGLNGLLTESMVYARPSSPRAKVAAPHTNTSAWTAIDDPRLPRAVFFHDSFGNVQRAFFAEHFSRLRAAWIGAMDPGIVEAEDPQVVFQEMAQRFLQRHVPNESMQLADNSRVRSAFNASTDLLMRIPGDAAAITPAPPLTMETAPGGTAVVHAPAADNALQLPVLHIPPGSFPVVRIEITSPIDAKLKLSYQTTVEPTYDAYRHAWWPLRAGENVAWLMVPDPELTGRLRLDVAGPAEYRVTSLQVRAVPRVSPSP